MFITLPDSQSGTRARPGSSSTRRICLPDELDHESDRVGRHFVANGFLISPIAGAIVGAPIARLRAEPDRRARRLVVAITAISISSKPSKNPLPHKHLSRRHDPRDLLPRFQSLSLSTPGPNVKLKREARTAFPVLPPHRAHPIPFRRLKTATNPNLIRLGPNVSRRW